MRRRTTNKFGLKCNNAGDPVVRPQSEFKVSTPVDKPPSAPLSAPPNVIEQAKMEGMISNTSVNSVFFFHSIKLFIENFSMEK